MKNKFLQEMQDKGFLNQCTDLDKLGEICNKKSISGYIGFDCTANSLHVGSLLQIMILKLMQKYGHQPIVLLGGGTTLIGDPSGKDTTRKILEQSEIKKNIKSIKKVFNKILDTSDKNTSPVFVDNADWLTKLNYIQFLRDTGSHFTINKMLTFDSVKLRLEREQSLSFLEFNYMIFQAYDFMKLYEAHKCLLQIGGSDQWGNIVNGVELIRRSKSKEAYGLTTPLITTSSGSKMGKTEKGAIWLDKSLLSPFDYWQFWRNTDDNDVINYLKLFTEISDTEITKLSLLDGSNINEAKIILANAATEMLHGKKEAEKAYKTSQKTFNEKSFDKNLPTLEIKKDHFVKGVSLKETLIKIGFATSNSDYKRNFKNLAYKINNSVVKNENEIISTNNLNENIVKISFGKKKHYLIKII